MMKRPSELYIALLLGLLATTGRVYFPTEPVGARTMGALLAFYATIFAFRGLTTGSTRPTAMLRCLAHVIGALPLAAVLGLMTGYGFTIAYIFFRVSLITWVTLLVVALGTAGLAARRGRLSPSRLRVGVATLAFVCAGCFGPLCMWMWAGPSPETCEEAEAHPAVTCLTPKAFISQRSYPYRLAYFPNTKRIVGAFKMGGNLAIGAWDTPLANKLAVIDVSTREAPILAVLPLEGDPLPQYMATGPSDDELVINRLGYERHLLDYIDLSQFPALRVTQRVETVPQPHTMLRLDDGRLLLATMRGEVLLLDHGSGEVKHGRNMETSLATPGLTLTDMILSPDKETGYLSMFGTDIMAFELTGDSLKMRSRTIGFGAGQFVHHPAQPRIYRTDFFKNVLQTIDSESLELLDEVALGFTPRPIALSTERDLMAVGEWIAGVVHFRRLSTGATLPHTIATGPYLRDLIIDEAEGLLFAATKCGVVMVDLEKLEL
jgi:hypothetical protein